MSERITMYRSSCSDAEISPRMLTLEDLHVWKEACEFGKRKVANNQKIWNVIMQCMNMN